MIAYPGSGYVPLTVSDPAPDQVIYPQTLPTPAAPPDPAPTGWRCPGCGACWAPHVEQCRRCAGG